MMKKLRYKYYNKRILNRDNSNVQSHDQEEIKLNSTIYANIGAHALTQDKIIKNPFNKSTAATIKTKSNSNKDLITRACRIGTMMPIQCSYSKIVYLSLLTGCLSIPVKTFCSHALKH